MYSEPFLQLVIGGTILAGTTDQDVWQIGLKVPTRWTNGAEIANAMNGIVADLETDAKTFWSALSSVMGGTNRLTFVKANLCDREGKYIDQNKTWRRDFAPVQAGANNAMPADVALVVTLETAAARGYASKGRFYLPSPSTSVISEGRLSSAARQTTATAAAAFVKNCGNVPFVDATQGVGDVSVMSKVGQGATRKVTAVRVGDLLDVQQRRSNRMREQYLRVPLPA